MPAVHKIIGLSLWGIDRNNYSNLETVVRVETVSITPVRYKTRTKVPVLGKDGEGGKQRSEILLKENSERKNGRKNENREKKEQKWKKKTSPPSKINIGELANDAVTPTTRN